MQILRLVAVAFVVLAGLLLGGCRSVPVADEPLAAVDARQPLAPHGSTSDAAPGTPTRGQVYYRGCRPVGPRSCPYGEVYAAAQAVAYPSWGPAVTFGQVFSRTRLATWSFEVDAAWQDLSAEIGGEADRGEFAQVRGGVKASFLPCGRGHPTARAGFTWFRTTEDTDWIDEAGDYVALYGGIGFEFDITRQLTTGPELVGILAAQEGGFDLKFAPQVRWHVIWKF